MGSANERRRYIVMPPLIGWAHTQNDRWVLVEDLRKQLDTDVFMLWEKDSMNVRQHSYIGLINEYGLTISIHDFAKCAFENRQIHFS